jgi:hypothetical protein
MARLPAERLDPRRVSVPGAARFLNCAESHVRRLADSGALPCTRDQNGTRIFLVSDLERYVVTRTADRIVRDAREA